MKITQPSIKVLKYLLIVLLPVFFSCGQMNTSETNEKKKDDQLITELNSQEIPIGDKTIAIVGVNLVDGISDYSVKNTTVIVRNGIISEVGEIDVLKPENATREFELLRLTTDSFAKKTGKRPNAYLAFIGNNPTMRTARAQFSGGFIGCGGFEIVDGIVAKSNEEAISMAFEQDADITVICGSDDDYATDGIEFARKFREAKKDGILVLAGYPVDSLEDLKAAGVDEFIHVRADLIETLKNFQQKLNIK